MKTDRIVTILIICYSCSYPNNSNLGIMGSCESMIYSDTSRKRISENYIYYCAAIHLIPYYYQKGKLDSIQQLLEDYKNRNRISFDHPRTEIIFSIIKGNLSAEHIYDIIDGFKYHRYNHKTNMFERRLDSRLEYDFLPKNDPLLPAYQKFNEFINNLADSLTHVLNPNSYEYLWALYYSKQYDKFFYALKNNNAFYNTYLAKYYNGQLKKKKNELEMNARFYSGFWNPNSNLKKYLGQQIEFGFGAGLKKWRLMADILIYSFRAGKIDNNFYIYDDNDDSIKIVKRCGNYYFGLDFGLEIFRTRSNELNILFGIGIDDIETPTENVSSLNINPGLGYRIYIGKFKVIYIGPELRYHFVHYEKDKNIFTDLSGNAFSLRLVFGINFFSSFDKSFYDTIYW